jgi:hypothetical protein
MSKVITFDDGTVYVQRMGSRWGRVNMQSEPFMFPDHSNEVMACAVQDSPSGINKGSTFPIDRSWFRYLDNFHTQAGSSWLWTPRMLWCNRDFVGDSLGSKLSDGADPEPVIECITGPLNIRRVIGETLNHYEVWSLPVSEKTSNYDPRVFNFYNFPWIFWKAQARTIRLEVQNVGSGLDVYHMNVRKSAGRQWMSKQHLTLFQDPPFTVRYAPGLHYVTDYMFLGSSIYGITDEDKRIPLLLATRPGQFEFPTDWRCTGPTVIPEVK